jgi:DNA-binding NarL/FixJ family response regulator
MDAQVDATSALPDFIGTTVFVVEDSLLIRERLLQMLAAMPAVRVVGQADTECDAIDQIVARQPNVVILDIKLKSGSGIKVLQAVKQLMPAIVVVMLTNYATPQVRSKCLGAGADHFLDKTNEFQKIASILEQQSCHFK